MPSRVVDSDDDGISISSRVKTAHHYDTASATTASEESSTADEEEKVGEHVGGSATSGKGSNSNGGATQTRAGGESKTVRFRETNHATATTSSSGSAHKAVGFRAGGGTAQAGEALFDLCAEVFNVPSSAHQIREYSITVSEKGGDVTPGNMSGAVLWLSRYTVAGAISYERGNRRNNLHLQGVCRLRWPGGKTSLAKLRSSLRGALGLLVGTKCSVCLKEIVPGGTQTFEKTLGYIAKDNVQAHFEMYLHNIPKDYAIRCYKAYVASNLHFEDQRPQLSKKAFYASLNGFYQEHLFPIPSIKTEELICWMMMSGEFIPAAEWGLPTNGGFLHQGRANALCAMLCLAPDELTMHNIMPLVFGSDFKWEEEDDITLEQFEAKKTEATLMREEQELPSHKERIKSAVDGASVRLISDLDPSELFGTDIQTPGSWLSTSWTQPQFKQPKRARKAPAQAQDGPQHASQRSFSSSGSITDEDASERSEGRGGKKKATSRTKRPKTSEDDDDDADY